MLKRGSNRHRKSNANASHPILVPPSGDRREGDAYGLAASCQRRLLSLIAVPAAAAAVLRAVTIITSNPYGCIRIVQMRLGDALHD